MRTQLEERIKQLKEEFATGEKMLADLENKQVNLRNTLLRISGAIQVLEEELGKNSDGEETIQQPFINPQEVVETGNEESIEP